MSKKILICDDEEGIREALKLILEDQYELIMTTNGKECLKALDDHDDIGIVLLDIKMPQSSGIETLEQIRAKHPKTKVVMVTGYKSVELAADVAQLGAVGYIVKPFESKEILETVKNNF